MSLLAAIRAAAASDGTTQFNSSAPFGGHAAQSSDRVTTILSADGIKGNAARMTAALDLSNASPGMSADEVVSFVKQYLPNGTSASNEAIVQPGARDNRSGQRTGALIGNEAAVKSIYAARKNQAAPKQSAEISDGREKRKPAITDWNAASADVFARRRAATPRG